MIIIEKFEDVEKLKEEKQLSKDYLKELKERFTEIYENIPTGKSLKEFSLEEYGGIVVLQKDDDVRNLEDIGFSPEDDGLLGSYPEWVECLDLGETKVYFICIVRNNENAIVIYSQVGMYDEEVENWLKEEAGLS